MFNLLSPYITNLVAYSANVLDHHEPLSEQTESHELS